MVLSMNPIKKEGAKPPLPLPKPPGVPLREVAIQERNRPTDSQIRMKDEAKLNRRSPVADEVGAGGKEEIRSESSKRIAARPGASVLQRTKGGFGKKILTQARGLYKMLQESPGSAAAEPVPSQLPQKKGSAISNPQEETGRPIDQLPNICTPGNYSLTLKLTSLEVRGKSNVKSKWILSVCHPPFAVAERQSTVVIAKPEMSDDGSKAKFSFDDGEEAEWEMMIPETGNEMLETPLKVNIYAERNHLGEPIAFAQIAVGNSVFTNLGPPGKKLQGAVGVYTIKPSVEKLIKIGYLGYDFTISQGIERRASSTLESPSGGAAAPSRFEDRRLALPPFSFFKLSVPDSDGCKRQEEQPLQQRLRLLETVLAYFRTRSYVHLAEREESEKAIREKTRELETMKKRYTDNLKEIAEKEEHLIMHLREAELHNVTNIRDDWTYLCRFLKHEKKLEIEGLSKTLDKASNVVKVALSQITALQTKLEMKDAKIAELASEKEKSPEQDALRKIDLLEQKVHQLGRDLAEALEEKERYLAQSKKLAEAEEMQALLRMENEELKLQIVAPERCKTGKTRLTRKRLR